MDTNEIRKRTDEINREIEKCSRDVTLGILSPNLSKLSKQLKKIQSKCPHDDGIYTIDVENFCDICHKKLK